ncbi:MAG: hypothetical protein JSV33_10930 [bacterium]|nr:MAG: hypothetical protein JSV33_10930 [bacterium]
MKRCLLLALVLATCAGAAAAQLPPVGYLALFIDEERSGWCVNGGGASFYPFEMWIYCLPSERGMLGAEFAVCYPTNIIQSTVTTHPEVSVEIGTLPDGISVAFSTCQLDWVWPYHQTLYVTDLTKTAVRLKKHPDPDITDYQFVTCEPGYPIEPVNLYTWRIFVNYEAGDWECGLLIGTKDSSWGAIKSMYNE